MAKPYSMLKEKYLRDIFFCQLSKRIRILVDQFFSSSQYYKNCFSILDLNQDYILLFVTRFV